jgi:hypothetical protein
MDIKDYWGVDSSPGSAQDTTHKCGHLFATMGAAGSATIASYSTDLGDRATVTPGTHPTINTGAATATPAGTKEPWTITPASAARGASLGFNAKGTTYFDSFAAMFGLPVYNTASDKLSISFWISPDDVAQGSILCSPWRELTGMKPANDQASPPSVSVDHWLRVGPYAGAGISTLSGGTPKYLLTMQTSASGPVIVGAPGSFVGTIQANIAENSTSVTVPDPLYTAGSDGLWYHVMFSMHATSGRVYCTLAVNDTVILDGTAPVSSDLSASITNEPFLFPFGSFTPSNGTAIPALRDNASQNSEDTVGGANVWAIGGAFQDPTVGSGGSILPEGDGLWGAVTELWIAEGQYIDWSNSANRNKFHTTDILGNVFVPTDLGAHGQTPTGTKPTMYFTGDPTKFIINRVNGVKCSVYKGTRNSLTLDGRYPGAL